MKCKKTQAYFTLNGKRADMVYTEWETEDSLCYDEIMHYYRQWAKIHKVELEWVKYNKKYVFKKASRGEQGVNPLKPLGVSVKSGKRQNAGSPRNPESFCRCTHNREAHTFGKCAYCGCIKFVEKKKEGLKKEEYLESLKETEEEKKEESQRSCFHD